LTLLKADLVETRISANLRRPHQHDTHYTHNNSSTAVAVVEAYSTAEESIELFPNCRSFTKPVFRAGLLALVV